MNIFRLAGDLSHLLAIVILLIKIWKTRSCAGKVFHFFVIFFFILTSPIFTLPAIKLFSLIMT